MWDTLVSIAAIVGIILILQLLGLPEWIDKIMNKQKTDSGLSKKLTELEDRIKNLEMKVK
jgi:hypothetical protein